MLRVLALAVLLLGATGCAERVVTTHTLFDGRLEVALPEGYELLDQEQNKPFVGFITRGGHAALTEKLPGHSYEPGVLKWTLKDDRQAHIIIILAQLNSTEDSSLWWTGKGKDQLFVPPNASALRVYEQFCKMLSGEVGRKYILNAFDAWTQSGRCVARFRDELVAMYMRLIDNNLVLVGGADIVEVLILNEKLAEKTYMAMTNTEKWRVLKAATNADVAEQVLMSAKIN